MWEIHSFFQVDLFLEFYPKCVLKWLTRLSSENCASQPKSRLNISQNGGHQHFSCIDCDAGASDVNKYSEITAMLEKMLSSQKYQNGKFFVFLQNFTMSDCDPWHGEVLVDA